MTPEYRRRLVALWYGMALASLFFYPLLQAVGSNMYYLFWQRRDSIEFGVAYGILIFVCALCWYGLARLESFPRLQLLGTAALALVPLTSFAVASVRQMPIKETLIPMMAKPGVRVALVVMVSAVATSAVAAVPKGTLRIVRGVLLLLSLVALIVGAMFVRLYGYHSHSVSFNRDTPGAALSASHSSATFVFLFDELSFRFMHEGGVVSPDLPHLRRLSERSTNYLAASAPGTATITNVPSLLAGRAFFYVDAADDGIFEVRADGSRLPLDLQRADGLFGLAKSRGVRTEVVGYYLPYCRLLADVADSCRSFSWYNYSTVADGFSPLNPVLTNLILWPYQVPFGVLKIPALDQLQRRIVDKTISAALADVTPGQATFRFVHFSVPHVPFVFDRSGFSPSADPMRQDEENYRQQLRYVDTIVGVLLAGLDTAGILESSTVVVMSDHEYRWPQLIASEASHIPLLVKHPGQHSRDVVTDPVRAEQVLVRLVRGE